MYKNVQGPHSPLSPLPPFDFQSKTSNVVVKGKYLTPANSQRNIHLRRSFTPHLLNITPPSASPIKPKNNESSMDLSILVIDDNEKTCEFITPEQKAVKQTSGRTFTIGRKTVKWVLKFLRIIYWTHCDSQRCIELFSDIYNIDQYMMPK